MSSSRYNMYHNYMGVVKPRGCHSFGIVVATRLANSKELLGLTYEVAQFQTESCSKTGGNFYANAHFAELYGTNVSAMDIRSLGKIFLRKTQRLPLVPDSPAERSAGESGCLWHAIFLESCIRLLYRRSSA